MFFLGLSNGDFHHVQKPDGQRVSAWLDDHKSSPNESLSVGDWPVLRCSQQILPGLHLLPLAGQFNEDCKGVSNTQLRFRQDWDYIAGNTVILLYCPKPQCLKKQWLTMLLQKALQILGNWIRTIFPTRKEREREREVVCGQVWWPILGICPLHLTHPSAHSQQWTHTWSSGQPYCGARGAVGGSVPCSRVSPQSWYWRWREHLLFTPPTDNPCRTWESNRQPLGYKSNSLTIRPRLPGCTAARRWHVGKCCLMTLLWIVLLLYIQKFIVSKRN